MSPLEPTQEERRFPKHLPETRHKERMKLWQWSNFSQLKLSLHLQVLMDVICMVLVNMCFLAVVLNCSLRPCIYAILQLAQPHG